MKVVGFDLDDTLVPEILFVRSGIQHISKWISDRHPSIPELRIASCMETAVLTRQNHYTALERIISEYGLDARIDMKETVRKFRLHVPDPAIYHPAPSIISILSHLKADPEIKTVLITDGRSTTQRNKIHAAALDAFFDAEDIFISEETGHDKTDPDVFLHVMERYTGAKEFHYIGDNPSKDFLHPSRLGWITHTVHPFPLMIHHQGMPR